MDRMFIKIRYNKNERNSCVHFSLIAGSFKQTRVGGGHQAAVSHFNLQLKFAMFTLKNILLLHHSNIIGGLGVRQIQLNHKFQTNIIWKQLFRLRKFVDKNVCDITSILPALLTLATFHK